MGGADDVIIEPACSRLPGEGPKAYSAFCAYLALGPNRSLSAVRHSCGSDTAKSLRLMERWSGRWEWSRRCRAWDSQVSEARLKAGLRAAAEGAAALERRRQEALIDAWADATVLRAKGLEMVSMDVFVEVTNPDGSVTRMPSPKASFKVGADMVRMAVELKAACLAAGDREFEGMTEADLLEIANVAVGEAGPTT
jgi:hypothetical protein